MAPVASLIVLLFDHAPGPEEIRRIQAQENCREELSVPDQQQQFRDCYQARAGLPEPERIAAVCADLGIGARKAHNLRRQLTLPEPIRARVAERPAGGQLSATLANRLADMHDVAPALTEAVAQRISTPELHERALADLGAFVHRTLVEDEHAWAVRIDDGARLDCSAQLTAAREQLTPDGRGQLAAVLGCPLEQLDGELDALVARARASRATLVVDAALRQRARAGGYAYVHERGPDFAAGVWIVDPVFLIDALREALTDATPVAADPGYFAGARLRDEDLRAAAGHDAQQRAEQRQRRQRAADSNLGLGHDLRAGLIDPTPEQLAAVKAIVCHLLARHGGELIAAGAGWSQREHQHPVGERGRHEPRQPDTILAAELERALAEPDPLRAITALAATWAAAFVLDPDGLPRGGALGSERIARRAADALPAEHPLRDAVWALLRPLLSPRLAELHRDAFTADADTVSTVDLEGRRDETDLDALDLGDDIAA